MVVLTRWGSKQRNRSNDEDKRKKRIRLTSCSVKEAIKKRFR